MIDRNHKLPLTPQAKILNLSRSRLYYQPRPVSERDQRLRNKIDRLHLEIPFAGARMLPDRLKLKGEKVGRKHVSTLMKKMGIEALYRKPNTSKRHPQHKIYPYLLRNLTINRPNQVWAMDITYIPMARGFVYLTAVVDWYSRKILSWRLSNTQDTYFCLEAVDEAIGCYGTPEIFNTDQGSQFTSTAFTQKLKDHQIRISMDGKGNWRDNVFVERLWRTIKYDEVYLKACRTVTEAKHSLADYIDLYNKRRPHSSFDGVPPDTFYYQHLPLTMAA